MTASRNRSVPSRPASAPPEVVDPRWIAKAFALTLLAAIICGYIVLCLQYYIGAWQLILHPAPAISVTSLQGITAPVEQLRFDADEAGNNQLAGIFVRGDQTAPRHNLTMLCMANAQGTYSNANTINAAAKLGISTLLFDYRGFGKSVPLHPHEATMTADAEAALNYLQNIRKFPLGNILLCGEGIGASIAASAASAHGAVPSLITTNPDPQAFNRLLEDKRSSLVPARWLSSDRFNLTASLQTLRTPKLLIQTSALPSIQETSVLATYNQAASPKRIAHLDDTEHALNDSLVRFLDEYIPTQPRPML